jgi:uncharacterized protein YbcC (UPF0753/DUF2309 family)
VTSPGVVRAKALAATDALPPTFPIRTFVAANPLHRLEHHSFEAAAAIAAATCGARSFLTEQEYRELYTAGRIGEVDLQRAALRRGLDMEDLAAAASPGDRADPPTPERSLRTLSEQADRRFGGDLADRIDAVLATWCAVALDEGQADWVLPHRELGLFGAWRRLGPRDPGLRRLVGRPARRRVGDLPESAAEALAVLVGAVGIPEHLVTDYFRASLRRLPGWAAAMSRAGGHDAVVGFLALRLALEHLALPEMVMDHEQARPTEDHLVTEEIERLATWQEALELGYRDHLLGLLGGVPVSSDGSLTDAPTDAQVVMCIDVRSEGLRRQLEARGPYATVGFAGFFGLPVRVAGLEGDPVASCPVIVEPRATVVEVPDGDPLDAQRRHDRHVAGEAAWDARHDAKTAPAAPFAFAEAAGWVLGPLAALNTFSPSAARRLRRVVRRRSAPPIPTRMDVGPEGPTAGPATAEPAGLHPDEQVLVAHGALTTMGMTSDFAPLVMFCGHRSATTNNPFAAALDCGACAGKAGGPNARALAELLNRSAVREGLAASGISIPETTWFVAAEHETTTDTVHVLDRHRVPAVHLERLARLESDLTLAGAASATERAAALPGGRGGTSAPDAVRRRSADWAEPVPEWGLVRNAAVVVGPRSLTAGRDLQRRVFLHSYDPAGDPDGVALGTILTGPLVVGHWISSQYYFSSVDPVRHGAGTKPLHNVVAGIGVLEGPGGDLRVGLPLESVQFAGKRVHEPMRLLAVVQAPRDRLDRLIAHNAAVARLLDGGWVRLVAGSNDVDGWAERRRDGSWEACPGTRAAPTPFAGSMSGGSTR